MGVKDRQREEARRRMEQRLAERAAQTAKRRRRNAIVGAVVGVIAVVIAGTWAVTALGGKSHKHGLPSDRTFCNYNQPTGEKPARNVGLPPVTALKKGKVDIALNTNQGNIGLQLDRSKAPCTANSFGYLAVNKYFDNTPCHRLTTENIYVLQCGDPTGTGTGGPGYQMPEENKPKADPNMAGGLTLYPKGTLAMAKAQAAGSTGSQFFLVYKDTYLTPDYTVAGRITSGMDVIEKIAAGGVKAGGDTPGDGAPNLTVNILTATATGDGVAEYKPAPASSASTPATPSPSASAGQ
ncbi:MAG: peptidylprolyl isomerase [Mycobacteriales bacterium]